MRRYLLQILNQEDDYFGIPTLTKRYVGKFLVYKIGKITIKLAKDIHQFKICVIRN